jgi:pimeloyl-ACP methyl ester carboxylesterase
MTGSLDRHRIETSGGRLAFVDVGEGEAVVLLHGYPLSSHLWRAFVPLLAQRLRVVAPDLLGCGDSEALEGRPLDLRSQARSVRELLRALGVERFAAVGHGAGGAIAMLLAVGADDDDLPAADVGALVLIDSLVPGIRVGAPSAPGPRPPAGEPASHAARTAVASAIERGMRRPERLGERDVAAYLRPFGDEERARQQLRAMAEAGEDALAGREAALGRLERPAFLLWGEDDALVPVAAAERLQAAMPSATLAVLPGCGHLLPEDAPETIAPLVAEWLRVRYLGVAHRHDAGGPVAVSIGRRPPIDQEFLGPPGADGGSGEDAAEDPG